MTRRMHRTLAVALALALGLPVSLPQALATCGGGGGGGMGGATAGRGEAAASEAYHVPWRVVAPGSAVPEGALHVVWFPTSVDEAKASNLLISRTLTLSSARCVGMALITTDNRDVRAKYTLPEGQAAVVLEDAAGTEIGRIAAPAGKLDAHEVDALVQGELDRREKALESALDAAREKLDQKDLDGAAALFAQVSAERCLFPAEAKKATKALKKMGRPVAEDDRSGLEGPLPTIAEPIASEIVRTMNAGLAAEREGRIVEARRLYVAATRMDPADPVPLRFLGELDRHHTGDWSAARRTFERLLGMSADPISRAVALHGLGKMTIHEGQFAKGLALFEDSLAAYPLALTYRNLAVYWNSEKDFDRAYSYVEQAMALDPDDTYNQIFAATYLVGLGRREEAEQVARRHAGAVDASYNLAAIWAALGNREKTLELLRRHFYEYERFDAVRRKEMREARDDIFFAPYLLDPAFVELTSLADRDMSSFRRKAS